LTIKNIRKRLFWKKIQLIFVQQNGGKKLKLIYPKITKNKTEKEYKPNLVKVQRIPVIIVK